MSENRGYAQTSIARFLFALGSVQWFEPFQAGVAQARIARVGLLKGGDLQNACWTYNASIPLLLACASTLDDALYEARRRGRNQVVCAEGIEACAVGSQ